jgi:hypothetical protein
VVISTDNNCRGAQRQQAGAVVPVAHAAGRRGCAGYIAAFSRPNPSGLSSKKWHSTTAAPTASASAQMICRLCYVLRGAVQQHLHRQRLQPWGSAQHGLALTEMRASGGN